MKKRLLITVGDSFTVGVGSYDPIIAERYNKLLPTMAIEEKWEWAQDFHEYYTQHGWPIYLQKLLKCDHLINCSRGGASNSGILKTFVERYENETFSDYDVTLIWGMTWPERISFYAEATTQYIRDVVQGMNKLSSVNDLLISESRPWDVTRKVNLRRAYVEFINDIKHDTVRESVFYKSLMHMLCKSKGWNFSFWWCDKNTRNYIRKLHTGPEFYDIIIPSENGDLTYKPLVNDDNHCNEEGYKRMALDLFNKIIIQQPQCMPPTEYEPNKYTSEWTGAPIFHKSPC